jgi:hypothetical protein
MPFDAPVTIATLLDSLLIFTFVLDPTPRTPNVHRCEVRLARMRISIYAPYIKERFETARQHSFLHPERIVGNPEAKWNLLRECKNHVRSPLSLATDALRPGRPQ